MLGEVESALLEKGAYGITRDGRKVKYLGLFFGGTFGWGVVDLKSDRIEEVINDYWSFDS